ncbi:mucin-binding protein [Lactobacillus agrestimuris]|uniref:mucin-binding protein n=1 Tax=Lactobacillus agrestimuris TaxID=2941328 RepID=UPI00204309EA|nr:YSIRK-type signal peptide-containing protein [Lactobacillus agrestimuris]
MILKRNFEERMLLNARQVQHFGLRKLSVGVASVLLGTSFYFGAATTVHAATNKPAVTRTEQVAPQEASKNIKTTTSKDDDPIPGGTKTTTTTTEVVDTKSINPGTKYVSDDNLPAGTTLTKPGTPGQTTTTKTTTDNKSTVDVTVTKWHADYWSDNDNKDDRNLYRTNHYRQRYVKEDGTTTAYRNVTMVHGRNGIYKDGEKDTDKEQYSDWFHFIIDPMKPQPEDPSKASQYQPETILEQQVKDDLKQKEFNVLDTATNQQIADKIAKAYGITGDYSATQNGNTWTFTYHISKKTEDPVTTTTKQAKDTEIHYSTKPETQTIKRTINVQDQTPIKQTATIQRTPKVNNGVPVIGSDGKLAFNDWTTDTWDAYTPISKAGYTTLINNQASTQVTAKTVKDGDKDTTVNITYAPNDLSFNVHFKTKDGQLAKNADGSNIPDQHFAGKTDEDVTGEINVPAGWEVVGKLPKLPDKYIPENQDLDVIIQHKVTEVPADKVPTPTDKVPGEKNHDPKTNPETPDHDITYNELHHTVTRTITVIAPDGTIRDTVQEVHFKRNALVDNVTGEVTYTNWQVDGPDNFAEFDVPQISGYTPSQATVAEIDDVQEDTKDIKVMITYHKNATNQPDRGDQTGNGGNPSPKGHDGNSTSNGDGSTTLDDQGNVQRSSKHTASQTSNKGNSTPKGHNLVAVKGQVNAERNSKRVLPQTVSHGSAATLNGQANRHVLPQTGDDKQNVGILCVLGLLAITSAGIFGLLGKNKKKN